MGSTIQKYLSTFTVWAHLGPGGVIHNEVFVSEVDFSHLKRVVDNVEAKSKSDQKSDAIFDISDPLPPLKNNFHTLFSFSIITFSAFTKKMLNLWSTSGPNQKSDVIFEKNKKIEAGLKI